MGARRGSFCLYTLDTRAGIGEEPFVEVAIRRRRVRDTHPYTIVGEYRHRIYLFEVTGEDAAE